MPDKKKFCDALFSLLQSRQGATGSVRRSTRCSRLFCHPDLRQNMSVERECWTGRISENSTGLLWLSAYWLCHIRNGRCNSTQTAHSLPHRARWFCTEHRLAEPKWARPFLIGRDGTRCSHFSSRDSRLDFWLRFFPSNFVEIQHKEGRKEENAQ